MKHDLKQIGNRISARRNELNLSQYELAEMLNISNTHLSNIERGKKAPGFILFLDICTALNIDSDYFIDGKVYPDLDEELISKIKKCSDEYKFVLSKMLNGLID